MIKESFIEKLEYILSFNGPYEDEDEDEEDVFSTQTEILVGSNHQFFVLDVNKINDGKDFYTHRHEKTLENINYQKVGLPSIHVLDQKQIDTVEYMLYFFTHKNNYYLIKSFCDKDRDSQTAFTEAMKCSSLEKLIKTIPEHQDLSSFSKEDKHYLTSFLEKEQLEKNVKANQKASKKIKL
jgi:hypothetical protein